MGPHPPPQPRQGDVVARCVVLALLVLVANPTPANALTSAQYQRCVSLTSAVNAYRVDVRRMNLLCYVGAVRANQMAHAKHLWHDLRPVMRALISAGICWHMVGEVLAWNNYSGVATAFVTAWRGSPSHWSILMDRRFDRGGGGWQNRDGHWAVYYVLDTC